jgi:hypothetical protein
MLIVLPHPPYSPNLALCSFNFFGILKDAVCGCCFAGDHELKHSMCENSDAEAKSLHDWHTASCAKVEKVFW